MRRVRIVTQRVQKYNVQAPQFLDALAGNLAVVRQVCAIAETKSMHGSPSVRHADGLKFDTGHAERLLLEQVRFQARAARFRGRAIKDIAKSPLDNVPCLRRGEDRD